MGADRGLKARPRLMNKYEDAASEQLLARHGPESLRVVENVVNPPSCPTLRHIAVWWHGT